jgi:hypothetical protein
MASSGAGHARLLSARSGGALERAVATHVSRVRATSLKLKLLHKK